MTYEHGIYAKLLMVEAYKQEIDSFGFVHGYMFSKNITPDYANIPHGKGKIKGFLDPKKLLFLGNIKGGVLLNMEVIKILSLKQWEIGKLKI